MSSTGKTLGKKKKSIQVPAHKLIKE